MPIIYGLVARGTTVLAEYTSATGNFQTVTTFLLSKLSPTNDTKMSYEYDSYNFHCMVDNQITYLCMCINDDNQKRRIPFSFLNDLKEKFVVNYGDRVFTAMAYSMNEEFSKFIKVKMDYYNSPAGDNFTVVNNKLDDVKNIMFQNINIMIERGEKLEILVEKTEQLQQNALMFQRSAKTLKSTMIWRRIKLFLLIFVVLALIVWIITVIVCGITYDKCK